MIVMWIMIIQSSSYILKRKPVENPNKRLDINEKQYYGQKLKKYIYIILCQSCTIFYAEKDRYSDNWIDIDVYCNIYDSR